MTIYVPRLTGDEGCMRTCESKSRTLMNVDEDDEEKGAWISTRR